MKINLGCSGTRYADCVNVDIAAGPNVDLVGCATRLPVSDGSVSLLFHNAVFEHLYVCHHGAALAEADRVLGPQGYHIALGIPDFRAVATLYLSDNQGIVGPRFDLYNAYRYTHGLPEQHVQPWDRVDPSVFPDSAPAGWLGQLHKSLFDSDYLHAMLGVRNHVVFGYQFLSEPFVVSLGFIVGPGDLGDPEALLREHAPWSVGGIAAPGSVRVYGKTSRSADLLSEVR